MDRLMLCGCSAVDSVETSSEEHGESDTHPLVNADDIAITNEEDNVLEISAEQYQLIRATWSDDFEVLFELASHIYTYIFDNYPQAKAFFPHIHRHGPEWKYSEDYAKQSLSFVQSLSMTVWNVTNVPHMTLHLRAIGRKHAKFASRGVQATHFDILEGGMLYALNSHIAATKNLTDEQKCKLIETWRKMARYIAAQMKCGFAEAADTS